MACRARAGLLSAAKWLSRPNGRGYRFYGKKPKYYKEVAYTYAKFRREVSGLRKDFRAEWVEQQKMTQAEFSAKTAEEARQKEMEEASTFEEAAREVERMAKEREVAQQRQEERARLQRERGKAAQLKREERMSQILATRIETVENDTKGVLTSENLDEKIKEALAEEVLEDFIISPNTGEKKTITFRNLK